MTANLKPLGRKAYGSIPHLPGSRTGSADHSCHEGQAFICTRAKRDKHDVVTVTEKLDGSCMGIAMIDGEIVPLGRAGWPAATSPFAQHHEFQRWVSYKRFKGLPDRWRVMGEWLYQAHSTIYEAPEVLEAPFIGFDVINSDNRRLLWREAKLVMGYLGIPHAAELHSGPSMPIAEAMEALGPHGHYGAADGPEGAVWRVEREGRFNFMAKYVRPDKRDGIFLPELESNDATEPRYLWPLGVAE